jgi:hypothetical protein
MLLKKKVVQGRFREGWKRDLLKIFGYTWYLYNRRESKKFFYLAKHWEIKF